MANRRRGRSNPYRPGTPSHARFQKAALKRRAALARANAASAKTPETRRRAKRRASAAERALREIETREEYRSKLNMTDRASFDRLLIAGQQRLLAVTHEYPHSFPRDLPDPFPGPKRELSWRLFYATRAGIRLHSRT